MKKITLTILGMSCVSCAQTIEAQLQKLPGVIKVNVNFATGQLWAQTKNSVSKNDLIEKVRDLGYEIEEKKPKKEQFDQSVKKAKNQALTALFFGLLLMGIMLGKHFLNQELFHQMNNLPIVVEALLTFFVVYVLGWSIHRSGLGAIKKLHPNMDTLISLGSSAAFWFGVGAFFWEIPIFFEVAAFIISFQLIGRYLEVKARGRTSWAIKELASLKPKTARILKNDQEIITTLNNLTIGDIVLIKPGEMIPADGQVTAGESTVDESIATGESLPVTKTIGSRVLQSTINQNGWLKVKIDKIGPETFLSQIITLIEEAQGNKIPIQKLADQATARFVPIILIIALITLVSWSFLGQWPKGLLSAITVLIIACPCALGLATPTALTVGIGEGAKKAVLIRRSEAIEKLNKLKIVVLDKTGTITQGKLTITNIETIAANRKRFLAIAASLENHSEHPIAKPIIQQAKREKIKLLPVDNFLALPGKGIRGKIDQEEFFLGTKKFLMENKIDLSKVKEKLINLEKEGKTIVLIGGKQKLLGFLALADRPKKGIVKTVDNLNKMGFETIMLTGDHHRAAQAVADQVKISKVIAEVLPKDKVKIIKRLQKKGQGVAMVGDGINDAPALTQADVGIAIGSGADIAAEAGDIVLSTDNPEAIVWAIKLSQKTLKVIKQNLFWAFLYNTLAIPAAALGLLATPAGPIIGAGAMSLSSLSVVINSLKIKGFLPKKATKKSWLFNKNI
ncbi:MAG: heavy metal translocating P-type ATPase [Candidatus Shapirobacteria bacterium]|nr:heavy metal translocating P-type ATPase [Candidatus Shapirobacteria bacterium]